MKLLPSNVAVRGRCENKLPMAEGTGVLVAVKMLAGASVGLSEEIHRLEGQALPILLGKAVKVLDPQAHQFL